MSTKEMRGARRSRDRSTHLSPDAEALVSASLGLASSGSRFEDRYWEAILERLIDRALESRHSSAIDAALDRLNQTDGEGYGTLIEAVESAAELVTLGASAPRGAAGSASGPNAPDASTTAKPATDVPRQGLLVVAPVIVWTRFAIPSGAIGEAAAAQIEAGWREHVLAPGVSFRMVPWLYSIDQLPQDYADMRKLARRLAQSALSGQAPRIDFRQMPDTADMLADARFVVGSVVPDDPLQPAFRWQIQGARHVGRAQCLEQWTTSMQPVFEPLLPGCGFECMLPDAYNVNVRESDRRVRPYGIKAAVHYLTHAHDIEPGRITATVAAFGEGRVDEYRVGLSIADQDEVVRGIVWPLLGAETETDDPSPVERIRETLKEVGVTTIQVWNEVNEPDFCEDCGAPLFPGPNEEIVHIELPEEAEPAATHFH